MVLSRAHQLGVWGLTACLAVISVFFHVFILLQSARRAHSNGRWTPSDIITSALALQSVMQQAVAVLWMSLDLMDPQCIVGRAGQVLEVLLLGLRVSVLWNTALLLFSYSTKLVMEPVHCYTHAQELLLRHVRPTVALIPVCSLCFCCPLLATLGNGSSAHNSTREREYGSVLSEESGHAYLILYLVLCDVLPGAVVLKASVSIAVHLALHLRHLRSSTNGFHGPRLGAELHVIRMCLSLALVYLLLLAVELYGFYLILHRHQNVLVLSVLLFSLYSAVCGAVLTYGKESVWKELLHLCDLTVDRYPRLSCLKAPENAQDGSRPQPH